MRDDIEAGRDVAAKLRTPGNGPDKNPLRISTQIDELIAALQTRIDALKRVKESL
jgi:hypothetical protein